MKKLLLRILSVGLSLSPAISAHAQWSSIHSIYNGTLASDGAATFVLGNKGYVVAGSTSNDLYRYDTSANGWTNLGVIPASAGHAFAIGFALNGKGYVVGGDVSGAPVTAVWRYDPANTTTPWMQMNDFGGGIRDAGIAFVVNDTAYVGCGYSGTGILGDLWRYDEANDDWIQMANSLPAAVMFPACFVVNNRAFIATGSTNGSNGTNQMWEFNTGTQTFTPKAALPSDTRQAALAFGNNGYGYLGGGMADYTDNYHDMWRYNPDSNTWAVAADIPLLGASWASVFTMGNTAYVGLGALITTSGLSGTDSFYKYKMQVPTSVSNAQRNTTIKVYPNPATDVLYVDIAGNTSGELVIYNYVGAKVRSVSYKQGEAISLTNLTPGYYTIKLTANNNGTWYGAFLKK